MSLDRFRRLKEREAPEPEPKPVLEPLAALVPPLLVLLMLEIFIAPVPSNKSCLNLSGNVGTYTAYTPLVLANKIIPGRIEGRELENRERQGRSENQIKASK